MTIQKVDFCELFGFGEVVRRGYRAFGSGLLSLQYLPIRSVKTFDNEMLEAVNGRYMRLKNAEIGYSLPKQVVNKLRIDGLRIYVSGMNLLTFSDFKLWDPDLQTGAANYPNNRVYNIGVSLIF